MNEKVHFTSALYPLNFPYEGNLKKGEARQKK